MAVAGDTETHGSAESPNGLDAWLGDALGADVRVLHSRPLSGGAIQDNRALECEVDGQPQTLVLRCDAAETLAVSHGRADKFALLRAAVDAGVAAPRPLALCTDPEILGRPFMVIAHVPGSASGRMLASERRDGLTADVGRELARLHAVVPPVDGLEFLPRVETGGRSTVAQTRIARYRGYLDALPNASPTIELALRTLERTQPESAGPVLCHMDFRSGNLMIDSAGSLTGVLDWEFAEWGDPMEDLGWLCARCWRFGSWERPVGGFGLREVLYESYEAHGGRVDPDAVRWWETMATVRWAIVATQQAERQRDAASLFLALTGRMLPELELDLLDYLGGPLAAESAPTVTRSLIEYPSGPELLQIARQTLGELLPELESDAALQVRMALKAMGIAAREQGATVPELPAAPERLVNEIRTGQHDAPIGDATPLHRALRANVEARLRITNPRYLTRARATRAADQETSP